MVFKNWPQIGLEFQTRCERRYFPYHIAGKEFSETRSRHEMQMKAFRD